MNLKPKNIIVVGGGSGIGLATAKKLLEEGAEKIVLASRNLRKLKEAQNALLSEAKSSKQVSIISFDITNLKDHSRLIKKANALFGEYCDGIVISSGVNFNAANWAGFNISEKDWDRVMDTNLKGVFFLIRNFSDYLYHNGIKGNICVVSSISAHRDLLSVYQISKNAISGIVHAYGKHLYQRGIVLNGVEPGTVSTEMQSKDYTDGIREGKPWGDNALGRMIRAEEIAEIICFLMSDLGEVMSGTCVLAGGGCKSIAR